MFNTLLCVQCPVQTCLRGLRDSCCTVCLKFQTEREQARLPNTEREREVRAAYFSGSLPAALSVRTSGAVLSLPTVQPSRSRRHVLVGAVYIAYGKYCL